MTEIRARAPEAPPSSSERESAPRPSQALLTPALLRWAFSALLPRGRERIPVVVAWVLGLACVLAIGHRFRFSADLSDETFSIALPYRFVLGDKPFVDEISIQQTAGIVLFPFVWLYVKLTGTTTGLVLFVRGVHLLFFKGIAALSVYAAARRLLARRSTAIAVSFVPFAFVPHSIPNVGYNVIGLSLLTAGAFLTVAGVAEVGSRQRLRLFFLAGLAEGVMAFAYPPMAVAPILATPLVLLCVPSRRLHAVGAFIAGGAAAILAISPSLAFGGIHGVRRALGWGVHAGETHSSVRLVQVLEGLWHDAPSFYGYALVAIGIAWVLRARALVAIVVPAITVAIAVWFRDESTTSFGAIHTVTYAGAFAPALVVLAKPDSVLWRGTALVVLPSFAAAVAASFVSTQGIAAASLPLHASMVLFALLAARSLERIEADATFCLVPAAALMFVLVTRSYDYVYRDAPMAHLTETVTSGPFKGIRTTADRAKMFAELKEITRAYDHPQGRILFLYEAPGFYLFSRMRPSAHCVWQVHYGDQQGLLDYWKSYAKGHGIVVRLKGSPTGAIDKIVAPPERRLLETPHFIVYRDE